jgi:hypothetical protein
VPVRSWQRDRITEKYILRNEPLRRGTGKPHIVEQIYRVAGEVVYICPEWPNGVTEWQYRHMIKQNRKAARCPWQVQRRNPRVYARGCVRHSDHATIVLSDWYRVAMNTETETDWMT